jgi:hypothetical protein
MIKTHFLRKNENRKKFSRNDVDDEFGARMVPIQVLCVTNDVRKIGKKWPRA